MSVGAKPIARRAWSAAVHVTAVLPGTLLSMAIGVAAMVLDGIASRLLTRSWLEALVLAIILGAIVRTIWTPGDRWEAGIKFSAKTLLEIAVMLLGITISAHMIMVAGPSLLGGIFVVVGVSLFVSYGIGRLFGLPHRLATLIACGNSICGNSAIAVVAPVIGADGEDVATSIAFTAVLGVIVVITLPLLAVAWRMTPQNFGIFAGLTVYAVPQVLAATAPISSVSALVGTLVKLVRVLMLGPIVFVLSVLARSDRLIASPATGDQVRHRLPLHDLIPWFIAAFLILIAARSIGLIPVAKVASLLTIVSMSALGLGVDIRHVAKSGPRVIAVVTLSLLTLGAIALLLVHVLGASDRNF
jgi:uncharacterized integral membrane protein (TIGR00698 family)